MLGSYEFPRITSEGLFQKREAIGFIPLISVIQAQCTEFVLQKKLRVAS